MNVGFVGAGHIARALALGWSREGSSAPPSLAFHDVSQEAAALAAHASGGSVAATLADLVREADVVVVAVRPPDVEDVLAAVAPLLGGRALVSLAAGVPMERLRAGLAPGARVGRVMPNVAAALGLGVFLYVAGTLGERADEVADLFACCGDVVPVAEEDFDTATAIAGCMPGILALLVSDFARAGESRGIAPDVARRLAIGGVHGAAAVIAREGDPAAVIAAAATPGGMTAAAIASLQERDIATTVALSVDAAARRAKELA